MAISNKISRLIIHRALWAIDSLIPKGLRIIICTFPDGDDQGMALCLALQRADWHGSIEWLVESDPRSMREWSRQRGLDSPFVKFTRKSSFSGFWALLRARWVFFTHGLYYSYPPARGKTVVNLWHGMPVKRIWRGLPKANLPPQCSLILSTSPFFSHVLRMASGLPWNQFFECGLPRNDFLVHARQEAVDTASRLRGPATRLILFLPTYRKSKIGYLTDDGDETYRLLGLCDSDAEMLHDWLRLNHCKLLVKPHPMSVMAGTPFPSDEHWAMIDENSLRADGIGLYELLSQADLLITDISSVYVDFLLTGRPQIIFFPDQNNYERSRGVLLRPFEQYAPGPVVSNYEQLQQALDSWIKGGDQWLEKRRRLQALLNPRQDRSASDLLLERVGIVQSNASKSLQHHFPIVALVWAQYGPYHFARLRELSTKGSELRVLGVEIGSKVSTYAWIRAEVDIDLHTLFPGQKAESPAFLTIYWRALKYFYEQEVDVVFVPSYWPISSLALILASRTVGAKVVMMNDSHAATAKARWLYAWVKRWLVRGFDGALVAGTRHKTYFSKLGIPPDRIVTGYDVVDNNFFAKASGEARANADSVRVKLGLPQQYFLNVGRMVPKKNLALLVDAYKMVRDKLGIQCPSLVLVGSGYLEDSLKVRCLSLGLSVSEPTGSPNGAGRCGADVYFMGFRQIPELPAIYALALSFVLPSAKEEWGLVVNESMACGLPVVVSRTAGCADDLIKHGENGFVFDPCDASELAGYLQDIAQQPGLARRMGHLSQQIIANWGCDRFAEAARQVTELVLKDKRLLDD